MANFYRESASFTLRNAQLFDFVQTSSVALWNLRWQVQGFAAVRPETTVEELSDRFASGSNIRANNLKGACIETPWEDQLDQFAQIVSANLIAMYEGWAEELMPKFGNRQLIKQVQFPSRGRYGNARDGVGEAIAHARSIGISDEMKRAFYPRYSAHRKYSLNHLDSLLALYRYHKEIRNSWMHRGGIADNLAEDAWRNASTLARSDIGGRSSPALIRLTDGMMVKTNIFEAIQLSDVLLRIVYTLDAELCFTDLAEQTFLTGWQANANARNLRELPANPIKRARRLASICRKAGFVTPSDTEAIYQLGSRAGLITP
jgi:hypothetical protein